MSEKEILLLSKLDDTQSETDFKHIGKEGRIPKKWAVIVCLLMGLSIVIFVFLKKDVYKTGIDSEINVENRDEADVDEVTTETETETKVVRDEPMALSDSWEDIIASGKDGTYKEKYLIGDTKELYLGPEGTVRMKLVAMDVDELSNGKGYAPMTWVAIDLLNGEYSMNSTDTIYDGWPGSDLRMWLNSDFLKQIPEQVRKEIKTVKKYTISFTPEIETVASSDKIWIPSCREIFGEDGGDENNGPSYHESFPNKATWKMYHLGAKESSEWLLRSTIGLKGGIDGFVEGSEGGYYKSDHTYVIIRGNNKSGIVIGFCL